MLLRFKSKNHPQQSPKDHVDDRQLPDAEFWVFNNRFQFTIDVAATKQNARLPRYFTKELDGLNQPWGGERVWCNPPFSNIAPWCEKAWAESLAQITVMLLPANRTEQAWWHDYIEAHRDKPTSPLSVEFIQNRLPFKKPGQTMIGPNERPLFGCCLCIWDWAKQQK